MWTLDRVYILSVIFGGIVYLSIILVKGIKSFLKLLKMYC